MSQPPKFRAFLMRDPLSPYLVTAGGTVTYITNPTNIDQYAVNFPANWGDVSFAWGRSDVYKAVFRAITEAYNFTNEVESDGHAGKICRYVFYNEPYDGELYLRLDMLDGITWQYSQILYAKLNFVEAENDPLLQFSAKTEEAGPVALLKANESTLYDIAIVPGAPSTVQVVHDGIQLQASYVYNSISSTANIPIATAGPRYATFPLISVTKDGAYTVGEQKDQPYRFFGSGSGGSPPAVPNNSAEHNNYMYRLNEYFTFSIVGHFEVYHDLQYTTQFDAILEMHALILTDTATLVSDTVLATDPAGVLPGGQTRQVVFNFTSANLGVDPSQRLYYMFVVRPTTGGGGGNSFVFFGQQKIKWVIDFRLAPTPVDGRTYFNAGQALMGFVTEGQYGLTSNLLTSSDSYVDNIPAQTILTCGDALRNLYKNSVGDPSNPAIRMSWKQYFQDAFSRYGCGMGLDATGNFYIERMGAFFNDALLMADLGEVVGFKMSAFQDWLVTDFQTGFGDETFDGLNGKDAALLGSTWKMPFNMAFSKAEDYRSTFKAEPYVVEKLRAQTDQDTTSTTDDNTPCLLCIDTSTTVTISTGLRQPAPYSYTGYPLRRPNDGTNTINVIAPETKYNIELSPARDFRRLGQYLRGNLYKKDLRVISFQAGDKNSRMESDISVGSPNEVIFTGPIGENVSVYAGDLSAGLWKPYILTFTAPAPPNMASIMASTPHGVFIGTFLGKQWRAFVMDVKFKPSKMDAVEWRMLMSPTMDETLFIS